AYGEITRLDIGKVDNPLRFQGQYFDQESGLHYNRHRYYNPDVGRYLTPDPVKLAGGINAYQYVPNPTAWVDPLGLSCKVVNCPGGVLEAHENAGGHLIEKHVAQTEAQLITRLNLEPHIPAASTFKNLEEAEALVSRSLKKHRTEILEFLEGENNKHLIKDSSNRPVGVSIIRGTETPIPVYNFILVLKKRANMPDGYLLLTGYPEK
ncbi:RHS repeat-associated core domain-containing protein, partial [Pseudomonas sp. NFPP24]|uniref:RHS repeat-associated core domain-containing protein n=1 Tax=Pseudomonas sp. NFPP24 TaxID=1566228 RepID=UPI000A6EFB5B